MFRGACEGRLTGGGTSRRAFLDAVTADLLALPWKRKGKYLPLAMLLPHIGVRTMLQLCPTVLPDILTALAEETLGCAAAATVNVLLQQLHRELQDAATAPTLPVGSPTDPPLQRWLEFWYDPCPQLQAIRGQRSGTR